MTTLNVTTLASNQVTLSSVQLNQVIEHLHDMDTQSVIDIYNTYADSNRYERVYSNAEDSPIFDETPDYISKAKFGEYNYHDAYLLVNGQGRIISFNNLNSDNCPIDIEELAQWIVDNELFDEYGIEVTTLDDMLASIEDNITDDENMLSKLVSYLNLSVYSEDEVLDDGNDWDEYRIEQCMDWISTSYDYNQLNDIITHLNINYE